MALSDHDFKRVVLVNPETGEDYALMAAGDDFTGSAVAKRDFIRAVLVNPATGDDYKAIPGSGEGGGADGASAYEIAVANGFVGTEQEWLDSLVGADSTVAGPPGDSAYQVALDNGFVGTEAEWLASLEGEDGASGLPYQVMTASEYAALVAGAGPTPGVLYLISGE